MKKTNDNNQQKTNKSGGRSNPLETIIINAADIKLTAIHKKKNLHIVKIMFRSGTPSLIHVIDDKYSDYLVKAEKIKFKIEHL